MMENCGAVQSDHERFGDISFSVNRFSAFGDRLSAVVVAVAVFIIVLLTFCGIIFGAIAVPWPAGLPMVGVVACIAFYMCWRWVFSQFSCITFCLDSLHVGRGLMRRHFRYDEVEAIELAEAPGRTSILVIKEGRRAARVRLSGQDIETCASLLRACCANAIFVRGQAEWLPANPTNYDKTISAISFHWKRKACLLLLAMVGCACLIALFIGRLVHLWKGNIQLDIVGVAHTSGIIAVLGMTEVVGVIGIWRYWRMLRRFSHNGTGEESLETSSDCSDDCSSGYLDEVEAFRDPTAASASRPESTTSRATPA
jgi:hypothetical protein